jgi:hypothetical protein
MPFAFNSLSGDQRKEIAQVVIRVNRRWPVRSERFCRSKETAPARGQLRPFLTMPGAARHVFDRAPSRVANANYIPGYSSPILGYTTGLKKPRREWPN